MPTSMKIYISPSIFITPSEYEIISFVINGTRYQTTMFEYGSDYDKIIIRVNVGSEPGIIEYAISEIKYIDGTTIKDVTINADTVVSCGVRSSDSMVTAEISDEEIALTSISFTANISDIYSLIEYSGGSIEAVLYDGESIIATRGLSVGTNAVSFTGLSADTLYQYAVVACYDDLSGAGMAVSYLYVNAAYTQAVVLFDGIEVGQEGVSFAYEWYSGYAAAAITKLTLTANGETTELDAAGFTISGLYSDTEYTLTAYYVGTDSETASISLTFTTLSKAVPEVEITVTESTSDSLTFEVDYTDTDGVGGIAAADLYDGDNLVESVSDLTLTQFTFTGLSSYTQYTLKVTYRYNLNDGAGEHQGEAELAMYTAPIVTLASFNLESDYIVAEGGSIILKATLDNPDGVTFNSVVISGVTYSISSALSSAEALYVVIIYEDQFLGGVNDFTITQINYSIGEYSFSLDVTADNTVSVYIKASIKDFYVENIAVVRLVDEQYEETDYAFPSDKLYYKVTLLNENRYTVDSIAIDNDVYYSEDIVVADDSQTVYIAVENSSGAFGWMSPVLTEVSYSNLDESNTKSYDLTAVYCLLTSDEIVEISSAEELKNLTAEYNSSAGRYEYKYYKLTGDIDLSGYTWADIGNSMYGVFDGGGHTISNVTATGTYEDYVRSGLFDYADGIVANLTIAGMRYIVIINDASGTSQLGRMGIIAAQSGKIMVDNCDLTSVFYITKTTDGGRINIGYISGSSNDNTIKNSTVNFTAEISCDSYEFYTSEPNSNSVISYSLTNDETSFTTTYYYIDDYTFCYQDGACTLVSYTGSDTDITLPEIGEGISYAISDGLFRENTSIKRVTIPGSVTKIDNNAFYGCTSLESITILGSVTTIGGEAFYGCTSLVSVTISGGVTVIGSSAFYGCTSLVSITSLDGLLIIEDSAFYECTSLASITLPDSVEHIYSDAFSGCTSLVSVTLPAGWEDVLGSIFARCTSLQYVVIPASIKFIDINMFVDCSSLTALYYEGAKDEWGSGEEIMGVPVYFYSESEPTQSGNYWRYVDGVITVW